MHKNRMSDRLDGARPRSIQGCVPEPQAFETVRPEASLAFGDASRRRTSRLAVADPVATSESGPLSGAGYRGNLFPKKLCKAKATHPSATRNTAGKEQSRKTAIVVIDILVDLILADVFAIRLSFASLGEQVRQKQSPHPPTPETARSDQKPRQSAILVVLQRPSINVVIFVPFFGPVA